MFWAQVRLCDGDTEEEVIAGYKDRTGGRDFGSDWGRLACGKGESPQGGEGAGGWDEEVAGEGETGGDVEGDGDGGRREGELGVGKQRMGR